jgi:hypothetical protein
MHRLLLPVSHITITRIGSLTHVPKGIISHLEVSIFQMKERADEPQITYPESRCSASHYGRMGIGTHKIITRPRAVGQSEPRARQPRAISPPPLKRQRSASDYFNSDTGNPDSIGLPRRLPPSARPLRHRYVTL